MISSFTPQIFQTTTYISFKLAFFNMLPTPVFIYVFISPFRNDKNQIHKTTYPTSAVRWYLGTEWLLKSMYTYYIRSNYYDNVFGFVILECSQYPNSLDQRLSLYTQHSEDVLSGKVAWVNFPIFTYWVSLQF